MRGRGGLSIEHEISASGVKIMAIVMGRESDRDDYSRTDLQLLSFYLSLLPKLAYSIREPASNFLNPLFGKFVFSGGKYSGNSLFSINRPWKCPFIGNSRQE